MCTKDNQCSGCLSGTDFCDDEFSDWQDSPVGGTFWMSRDGDEHRVLLVGSTGQGENFPRMVAITDPDNKLNLVPMKGFRFHYKQKEQS